MSTLENGLDSNSEIITAELQELWITLDSMHVDYAEGEFKLPESLSEEIAPGSTINATYNVERDDSSLTIIFPEIAIRLPKTADRSFARLIVPDPDTGEPIVAYEPNTDERVMLICQHNIRANIHNDKLTELSGGYTTTTFEPQDGALQFTNKSGSFFITPDNIGLIIPFVKKYIDQKTKRQIDPKNGWPII